MFLYISIMNVKKNHRWHFLLHVILISTLSGCASFAPPPNVLTDNIPSNDELAYPIGRELDKVSMPMYTIEPPDVLTISANRIIPKSPVKIHAGDGLQINVEGTPLEHPIRGIFVVDPGGGVNLGPSYGRVIIANNSVEEASEIVRKYLKDLRAPQVSLTVVDTPGLQAINGVHQVGPDGTVSLGIYGSIRVTGLTIPQATQKIQEHLAKDFLEDPRVAVDVYQFASKKYTVITEGAGYGDNVQSFYITGNETVLDAVAQIQGISRLSSKNIWIARPAPASSPNRCDQILPVNWEAITKGANAATNYQLMPNDRLFIEENPWIAIDSTISKITAPFERILNFTLLGSNTVQSMQRFPTGLQQ
jgi:protein involved in polysaccharide export with SLBB domain